VVFLFVNTMEQHPRAADAKVIFGIFLIHFIGDFYISFVNPLLPVFVKKFSLTLTQVGLMVGVSQLLAFIVQPPMGYLADHYRTRFFILGGPLLTIVFIPLVGIAPAFLVLILFVSMGSIGSSMFHPAVAGMVSSYSGRHFGLSMSIFNVGGTLAFGVGPLFIAYFVSSYGLEAAPYTMGIGLAVMAFLFRIIPLPQGEGLKNLGFIGSLRQVLGTVWKSIMLVWIVMVLRTFVAHSFLTFIPVLYAKEGYSLVSIGTMVSLFTVAGSISGLLAGHLSDRIGYKPIFYSAFGLTTPSLYLLLYLPGKRLFGGVFCYGDSATGSRHGSGTGPAGEIDGFKPYDGSGFRGGRDDDPCDGVAGGYFFDPARSLLLDNNTFPDNWPHLFPARGKIEIS
jgi:FSR family fosmidomycin resistance protein-like MFS transporter